MIKLRDLITEVAWFRNLRKDGSTWMMTSGPEHKPKETKIKDILNVSGNNVKLYFLKEISDNNPNSIDDYQRYFALKRDAIKNGKGWRSDTMFVGMKLIPLKDLRVWGKAARQLIFIPAKGKGPVGKDISHGKYIKAHR